MYFLVDDNNTVKCIASHESNLHADKLETMRRFHGPMGGTVGDEYNAITEEWTARPENYPQPSQDELNEVLIQNEIRREAIDRLTNSGELPQDYKREAK